MERSATITIRPSWVEHLTHIQVTIDNLTSRKNDTEHSVNDLITLEISQCSTIEDWEVLLVLQILQDLSFHGWIFAVKDSVIECRCSTDITITKEITKKRHQRERDFQLQENSVRRFIEGMELPRKTSIGVHSIFSVIRDGEELSKMLESTSKLQGEARNDALGGIVRPYIQFVESGKKCAQTGLRLNDIWRYFRHTWSTAYKPVPGRSINILIRDEATSNHPVIGIASLGSSIVQQSIRDQWIGWTVEQALDDFRKNGTRLTAAWLLKRLNRQIEAIRTDDFILEGLIGELDLRFPRSLVINRLRKLSAAERLKHQDKDVSRNKNPDWVIESESHLYRSKRAMTLSNLLGAKNALQEAKFESLRGLKLRKAVEKVPVKRAISVIMRGLKSEYVGINMMDITVCGAIPPYTHLLGGKLICLLLMSREVANYYNNKYSGRESVISSSLRGQKVTRNPQLALLCTTSLYASGSSQYNRVKLPLDEIVSNKKGQMKFERLGLSEGYGSFQFSTLTKMIMNKYLEAANLDRQVRNLFGEGVNPLLRKLRMALESVGLPAEIFINHKNRRIVYGVPLAKNFRDLMIGRDKLAEYFLPERNVELQTQKVADFWRRRWLSSRINSREVLDRVCAERLSQPVTHSARVPLYRLTAYEGNK